MIGIPLSIWSVNPVAYAAFNLISSIAIALNRDSAAFIPFFTLLTTLAKD